MLSLTAAILAGTLIIGVCLEVLYIVTVNHHERDERATRRRIRREMERW